MVCLRCFSQPVLSFLSFWLTYAVTYRIFCRNLKGMWKFFCFLRFFSLYPPFSPRFQPFIDCAAGHTRYTYVGHDNAYMPRPSVFSAACFCPLSFSCRLLRCFTRPLRFPLFRRLFALFFCPLFCLFYIPLRCPLFHRLPTPSLRFFTRPPPLLSLFCYVIPICSRDWTVYLLCPYIDRKASDLPPFRACRA